MYRLAKVTEKLPADLLQDLLLGEKRLRGLLMDVQQTLTGPKGTFLDIGLR